MLLYNIRPIINCQKEKALKIILALFKPPLTLSQKLWILKHYPKPPLTQSQKQAAKIIPFRKESIND